MRLRNACLSIMLFAAVIAFCPVWGEAAAECEPPQAGQTPAPDVQGAVLEIASSFICEGMDRPYASGYMPTIDGDTAHIILPLQPADAQYAPDILNVSVGLGDTDAPFVFQNYDMRVPLTETEPESADMLYIVELSLPLAPDRPGGRYPVTFTCSGRYAGHGFSQSFTVYVTVPGNEPEPEETASAEPDPEPVLDPADPAPDYGAGAEFSTGGSGGGGGGSTSAAEPTQAPQPKLMIVSQSVSPSPVQAGEGFTLTVSLKNTSTSVPAANLLVTLDGDGEAVYPADGAGSAYFGKVKPGEVFSVTVPMNSSPEAQPGPKKVSVHAGYDGPQGSAYTQDESVTVETVQPVRFAVDEPDFPSALTAGETWSIPVNVMNMGRTAIRNVTARIEAPGIKSQTTLFLGNLESGTAGKGTLYAFVGPKSDEPGEARYGRTEGLLTVSCEDEYGAEHNEELAFATNIDAPVIRSSAEPEDPVDEEPALQRQTSVLIGAGIAGGAVAALIYRRKREMKRIENE